MLDIVIEGACFSECGAIRKNNEDNYFCFPDIIPLGGESSTCSFCYDLKDIQGIPFAVFDGMGGEKYGDEASFAAANELKRIAASGERIRSFSNMERLCTDLNEAVLFVSRERLTSHVGSTAAILSFQGKMIIAGNLGDSRIYRYRSGELRRISEDHVSSRPMREGEKAPLIQYLGIDSEESRVVPTVKTERWRNQDIFLICSDGITDMVSDEDINAILKQPLKLLSLAEMLKKKAIENGGKDNITAVLLRVEEQQKKEKQIISVPEESAKQHWWSRLFS